jgi:N4-gp56 family major capsid protein
MASTDIATLALFRSAVTRLRRMNVPTVGGYYVAHIAVDTETQLFADPDFKQALQGRVDSPIYRDLSIGRFAGIDWVRNNELPSVLGGSAGTVNVARNLVVGDGALTASPFEGFGSLLSGTGVEGVPSIRMVGPATGVQVALIIRPPQDRFQQNISSTWSWVGDFGVPSDVTSGDGARYKRAVMVETAF